MPSDIESPAGAFDGSFCWLQFLQIILPSISFYEEQFEKKMIL
jgi:hypothetical protein